MIFFSKNLVFCTIYLHSGFQEWLLYLPRSESSCQDIIVSSTSWPWVSGWRKWPMQQRPQYGVSFPSHGWPCESNSEPRGRRGISAEWKAKTEFSMIQPPCGRAVLPHPLWSAFLLTDNTVPCSFPWLWVILPVARHMVRHKTWSSFFSLSYVCCFQSPENLFYFFFSLWYFSPKMALLLWCARVLTLEWRVFSPQGHFPNPDSYF